MRKNGWIEAYLKLHSDFRLFQWLLAGAKWLAVQQKLRTQGFAALEGCKLKKALSLSLPALVTWMVIVIKVYIF